MTKSELLQALADKLGKTRKEAGEVLEALVGLAYMVTKKEGEFTLPGLGKLVKKLYICLDSDAIKNSIGLAEKFVSYGIETHLVELKDKDPSEMGYENINKLIYNTPSLTLRRLVELKMNGL